VCQLISIDQIATLLDQTAILLDQTAILLFTEPDIIDKYSGKDTSTPKDDFYQSAYRMAW
jgi:hypothetical protein